MKAEIHPDYMEARIVCACGRVTETRATVPELHVEICSHCHPFFTGKQKLVDTAGRVERFLSKYGREEDAEAVAAQARERSETGEKLDLPEEMQLPESKPKPDEEEEELEVVGEEPGSPAASGEERREGERGREEAGTGSD